MTARADQRPVPSDTGGDTRADTFPRLLHALADERPGDVAMQEKLYGIWQPITWSEYARRVTDFAHGLAALGVEQGEVVAVIGDNRPEWLIAELATQSIGAAVVGIYPTSIGEEIVHILTDARVRVVVAEDQEQVDKIIRLKDRLPSVHTVVYYDPHGLEQYREPYLRAFTDVEESGQEWGAQHPAWLTERIAAGSPDEVAVICTTSGTTARPKLAELSHANLLAMAGHLQRIDPLTRKDRYVSFLPFAWIGEQMLAVACGLSWGFTLSFPEDAATQRADLREIGPDVMFSPPRIWESMLSDVQVRIEEADRLKQAVFRWGYRVGDRYAERRVRGQRPGTWLRLTHRVADAVALRPVRDQLGLTRLKRGYTGGAPLGPDVFRFFHAIGVNLKQIYGQTEICGIAVTHTDTDVRFHTVGTPLPGTELRIAEDGEILLRSASVFRGYHRNPESTAETVDPDGWLHTGDAGYTEDGHLVVIDRAKDVRRTADGQLFSSAFVENKVKFSPYVEEAVVFGGESGSEVTAMIIIDPATTGAWAEHQHLSYTTYTDLAAKEPVYRLIAGAVARANEDLPESTRIRRFVLLHKQLDPDDDEITRTRKVRRGVIAERYADIISALDRGDAEVVVGSTITYQDGTVVDRKTPLRIFPMSEFTGDDVTGTATVWGDRR
ncbi:AMP-binding protein [Haloechinothrix sp. YIM 98757]|uniref:Acyl-CoA synthetase n=1 Tax=Haloechinothrix aidingensis TaxID=2752311 RepID=A0A838AAI4_9PSEU|nr:AMP-binding protein [Haloechinothrix aidingensis]MBA0126238.1 AMP-binding protein [Haloechinothrix aidingensis]